MRRVLILGILVLLAGCDGPPPKFGKLGGGVGQTPKATITNAAPPLLYTLHKVLDPAVSNMAAYTYLMPQGWRNEDQITWAGGTQPYPVAILAAKSPDKKYALGVYPLIFGTSYSGPMGSGGMPLHNASEAVKTLIAKAKTITNFQVLDEKSQPMESGYGDVGGAQRSADMAVIHCTYSEDGMEREAVIVSRFDNAVMGDQNSQSQTWTLSLQIMAAPPGELMKNKEFLQQSATFFYSAYITPDYYKATNKLTMDSAAANREAGLQRGEQIMKSYWDQQKTNDASAQNFSDSIRGVGRYTDPNGGAPLVLPEGPQYWVDRDGNVASSSDPNYDPNTGGEGGSWTALKGKAK